MNATTTYCPSRGDRWALLAFIAAGVAMVIATAVFAVARIMELLGPGPIAVPMTFAGFEAPLTYGNSGGSIPVAVDTGSITVLNPPGAVVIPGVIATVVTLLLTATVVACLVGLSASLLRGKIFSKRNSRLVATAGIVSLIGFAAQEVLGLMQSNAAIHSATGGGYESLAVFIAPGTYVIAAFAIAMVCTVFVIGERMQRDQEGLI